MVGKQIVRRAMNGGGDFSNNNDAFVLTSTTVRRVRAGATCIWSGSKNAIGTGDNPHFSDFLNKEDPPMAKTHHLLGAIRKIRQEFQAAYFNGKLNSCVNKRSRQIHTEEFFSGEAVFSYPRIGKTKGVSAGWARGLPLGDSVGYMH